MSTIDTFVKPIDFDQVQQMIQHGWRGPTTIDYQFMTRHGSEPVAAQAALPRGASGRPGREDAADGPETGFPRRF